MSCNKWQEETVYITVSVGKETRTRTFRKSIKFEFQPEKEKEIFCLRELKNMLEMKNVVSVQNEHVGVLELCINRYSYV